MEINLKRLKYSVEDPSIYTVGAYGVRSSYGHQMDAMQITTSSFKGLGISKN